ncbi:MAG: hypothetical protein KUG72_02430 [Pseudomonadales bacterium]|nr:hypothetical protein [Pseudomonadales bacterium]
MNSTLKNTAKKINVFCVLGILILIGSCGSSSNSSSGRSSSSPATILLDCGQGAGCPQLILTGDPLSTVPVSQSAKGFRGYGDPSIEFDSSSDTLWLSYSWLINRNPDIAGPIIVGNVESHLARSTDGGQSFEWVANLNTNEPANDPVNGVVGWLNHEVTSLLLQPDGNWQMLWFTYHKTEGGVPFNGGAVLDRSISTTDPTELSTLDGFANTDPWIGADLTHDDYGATHDLHLQVAIDQPDKPVCDMFTEPAHFNFDGEIYLGLNCLVFDGGRQVQDERFLLFHQTVSGYGFVAEIVGYTVAQQFGADRFEQVDITLSESGSVLFIGTPISDESDTPVHLGCVVLEFEDFLQGTLKTNGDGSATVLAKITDSLSVPHGTGACTYDRNSESGLIVVRRTLPPAVSDGVTFELLATGLKF